MGLHNLVGPPGLVNFQIGKVSSVEWACFFDPSYQMGVQYDTVDAQDSTALEEDRVAIHFGFLPEGDEFVEDLDEDFGKDERCVDCHNKVHPKSKARNL